VSFFNEVDAVKATILRTLVSFFNKLDTGKRTMLRHLGSFFNEVDTREKVSSGLLVSFFNELDTIQGTVLQPDFIIMNGKSVLPRVPLPVGGQYFGSLDPMPPGHYARRWH